MGKIMCLSLQKMCITISMETLGCVIYGKEVFNIMLCKGVWIWV